MEVHPYSHIHERTLQQMSITLKQIWESSTGLLERFELFPSTRKAWLKMQEELFELSEALFKLSTNKRNIPYKEDAADELADVIITALNVGYANGLTLEDIEKGLARKCTKNDAKSAKTHTAANGWIQKLEDVAYIEKGQ